FGPINQSRLFNLCYLCYLLFKATVADRPVDRDSGFTLVRSPGAVDKREKSGLGLCENEARRSEVRAWFENEVHDVILLRQCRDLRAAVILEVVPGPARTEGRSAKVTVIADEIAFDLSDGGTGERSDQRFKRFAVIAAVKAGREGRIAAPVNDQVSVRHAVGIRFGDGIERRFDAIARAKAVQRQR